MHLPAQHSSGTARALAALVLFLAGAAHAGVIEVRVLGPDGAPVPDVAVFLANDVQGAASATGKRATMDQVDTEFVPHILIIATGTAVEFPNSDIVAHHVYSFSKPNNFVLPLYKGDAHAPVTFEHEGVVTLGCNIHDGMLGYIVVVDTTVFGMTDAAGRARLQIATHAEEPVVRIWSPRIRDDDSTLRHAVDSTAAGTGELVFRLQKKLRPPHVSQSSAVQWSDY